MESRIEALEREIQALKARDEPDPPPEGLMKKRWSEMSFDEKVVFTGVKYGGEAA